MNLFKRACSTFVIFFCPSVAVFPTLILAQHDWSDFEHKSFVDEVNAAVRVETQLAPPRGS